MLEGGIDIAFFGDGLNLMCVQLFGVICRCNGQRFSETVIIRKLAPFPTTSVLDKTHSVTRGTQEYSLQGYRLTTLNVVECSLYRKT